MADRVLKVMMVDGGAIGDGRRIALIPYYVLENRCFNPRWR